MITSEQLGVLFDTAIQVKSNSRPRTLQSKAGIIGPSDLGFCRAQAVLKIRGVQQSDAKSTRAADLGTSWHEWVEDALRSLYPGWLIEPGRVTATYTYGPRTFEVSGTPDVVIPEYNMVVDIKTVDGLSWVRRNGASQQQQYQKHAYAKGCIAAGILDPAQPVHVANIWFDRSGREKDAYVGEIEELDPHLDDAIGQWLEDVAYAVEQEEEGHRDIASEVCQQICEYFTVCRGHLPDEDASIITDPGLIDAARMYHDGMTMEKEARRMKDEAKAMLDGVSGLAGSLQVRWTKVGASNIPGYYRAGYEKIAVVPARRMPS